MDLVEIAFEFVVSYGAPIYLILQVAALIVARYEGWRIAFMLPLVFSVPIAGWCALALAGGSNLWPLPFLLFAPFGAAYLLVALIARAIVPQRT